MTWRATERLGTGLSALLAAAALAISGHALWRSPAHESMSLDAKQLLLDAKNLELEGKYAEAREKYLEVRSPSSWSVEAHPTASSRRSSSGTSKRAIPTTMRTGSGCEGGF